jgi:predicted deacylase
MIKTYQFKGEKDGPHLLVFGAIHGTEHCGTYGIRNVAAQLEDKWLRLKSGTLTMVPICNQDAYDRVADEDSNGDNLNRIFRHYANPTTYGQKLADELATRMDQCDDFIDLHSQTSDGAPFVFQETDDEKLAAFAASINVGVRLIGWSDMKDENATGESMDTTEKYAHEHGKTGILVECGQHRDPYASMVATRTIMDGLIHLGMIDAPSNPPARLEQKAIRMHTVVRNFAEGGKLTKKWKHLEEIHAGEVLARSNSGREIIAPQDAIIILPKHSEERPGRELCYWGRLENTSPA